MTISALTFDTLEYCNELQKGGFTREQAEAQARAQSKIFSVLIEDHLVSKEELEKQVQVLLNHDNEIISLVRGDITRLDGKIQNMEGKIQNVEGKIQSIEHKIQNLGLKLTIRLGSLMVLGITVLSIINKL